MKTQALAMLGVALLAKLAMADPPYIHPIPDWEMEEDSFLSVDVVVTDADSPELIFWIEVEDNHLRVSFDQENMQIHCNPVPNWNGATYVTFGVDDSDGARTVDTEQFMVTVTPVNDCPVQLNSTPQPPLTTPEDVCLNITFAQLRSVFNDPDWAWEGDTLIFMNPNFTIGTVEVVANGWRLCTPANFHGNGMLTFQATDEDCVINSGLSVSVLPVNDCPVADDPWDLQVGTEDTPLVVPDLLAGWSDVDSPLISFCGISGGEAGFLADWDEATGALTLTPPPDFHGAAQLELCITDGSCQVTALLSVELAAVNDPPVLAEIHALELEEDGLLLSPFPIHDVDGPTLAVLVESSDPMLTAAWLPDTQELLLEPAPDWHGVAVVTVLACDGHEPEACVTGEVAVTVHSVNDLPVVGPLADVEFPEDATLLVELDVSDIDSAELLVQVASDDDNLQASWQPAGGHIRLQPAPDWHGTATVTVLVDDQDGGLVTVSFLALVTPVNDPPVLPGLAQVDLLEDEPALVPYVVVDVDGPALNLSVWSDDDNLEVQWLSGTAELSFLPAPDWHGTATVTVLVDDLDGGTATESFPVVVAPVNDPPVLPELTQVDMVEDEPVLVPYVIYDVDGPALTVLVWSDTENLEVQWLSGTAELSLVPAPDWFGTAQVSVRACDGHQPIEACVEAVLTVTVLDVDDAPVIEQPADLVMIEDTPAWLDLVVYDSDQDEILVTVDPERSELTVTWHPESSQLLLTPAQDWYGATRVKLTAADLSGVNRSSVTFTVTVTPVNDAPVLPDLMLVELNEDVWLELDYPILDVDGPALEVTVEADSNEVAAQWLAADAILRLVPAPDWHGQTQITIRACDGYADDEACVERQITVQVSAVNDAPVIAPLAVQRFNEDTVHLVDVVISDLDNDLYSVEFSCDRAEVAVAWLEESGQLRLEPAADWHGMATVTISVDDGEDRAVAQASFQVNVQPVNDAPYAMPYGSWNCGLVDNPAAFRTLLLNGGILLDVADVDQDRLTLTWYIDDLAVSSHPFSVGADTLRAWSLPAPPADLIDGAINLHAELSDGTVSLNPGGESCRWELDFTDLAELVPARFALGPAFPNPFNPSTHLPFVLEKAGHARLTIVDLRGAQVAVLVDGWSLAGSQEAVWHATGHGSGVYLAVLEAEGRRLVTRLTLVK